MEDDGDGDGRGEEDGMDGRWSYIQMQSIIIMWYISSYYYSLHARDI
jgi:hypothetical protein